MSTWVVGVGDQLLRGSWDSVSRVTSVYSTMLISRYHYIVSFLIILGPRILQVIHYLPLNPKP